MGRNPLFSLQVEHSRWHSPHESASDGAHMVAHRSSVNGGVHPFCRQATGRVDARARVEVEESGLPPLPPLCDLGLD